MADARVFLIQPAELLTERNRGDLLRELDDASNALLRAVFFHRQGEIRDRTFENQSFPASGLNLISAAIVHWN
jgi:TnpA family transposase